MSPKVFVRRVLMVSNLFPMEEHGIGRGGGLRDLVESSDGIGLLGFV